MDSSGYVSEDADGHLTVQGTNPRSTPELRRTHSPTREEEEEEGESEDEGEIDNLRVLDDHLRESVSMRSPKRKKLAKSSYLKDDEDIGRKSTTSNASTILRVFGKRTGDDSEEEEEIVGDNLEEDFREEFKDLGDGELEKMEKMETALQKVEEERKKKDQAKETGDKDPKEGKPRANPFKLLCPKKFPCSGICAGLIPTFGVKNIRTFGDVRRKKCKFPNYKGQEVFLTKKTEYRPICNGVRKQIEKQRDRCSRLERHYATKHNDEKAGLYRFLLRKFNDDLVRYEKNKNEKFRMIDYDFEGIYEGKKPYFSKHNEHIIEQGCYREQDGFLKYCDDNGSFISSFDPMSKAVVRPNTYMTDFDKEIPLKKTIPFISKISRALLFNLNEQANEKEEYYQLDVECQRIFFIDHPLMTEEEYCAQKLISLYNRYRRISSNKLIIYYEKKIEALISALNEYREQLIRESTKIRRFKKSEEDVLEDERTISVGYKMANIRSQLRNARISLEQEIFSQFQIVEDITITWNRLRRVRHTSRFWSTSVGLVFRELPLNELKQTKDIQSQVDQEYQEFIEEREWRKQRVIHEFGKKKLEMEDPLANNDLDESNKKKEIYERIVAHRLSTGQNLRAPELVKIKVPEKFTEIDRVEQMRQEKISKCYYFMKILINGKTVSRTTSLPLSKSFSINFGEIIPCIVTKWPDSICIEIRQKAGIQSKRIASLFVPAPGLEESANDRGNINVAENQVDAVNQLNGLPLQPREQQRRKKIKNYEELDFNGVNSYVPNYEKEIHIQTLRGGFRDQDRGVDDIYGDENININNNNNNNGQFGNHPREHYICGRCVVRVSWGSLVTGGLPKAPPIPEGERTFGGLLGGHYKNMLLPTAKDLLNMQKMKRLLEGNTIDPNDPKNTGLLSMFELLRQKKMIRPGFFLTEQDDGVFLIPPKEYLKYLRKYRFKDDEQQPPAATKKTMDPKKDEKKMSKRREYVGKYVREPNLPTNVFRFAKNWIWSIFARRTPLNPERRSRDEDMAPTFSSEKAEDIKIYCQILSAQNIPMRDPNFKLFAQIRNEWLQNAKSKFLMQEARGRTTVIERKPATFGKGKVKIVGSLDDERNDIAKLSSDDGESEGEDEEDVILPSSTLGEDFEIFKDELMEEGVDSIFSGHPIEAFVEVYFQGKTASTTTYSNHSPQIGETLVIPLSIGKKSVSPEDLMNVEDIIFFDFFDMFQAKLGRDDDPSVVQIRKERRYLGTFSLPFSTLFLNNGSVTGKFKVHTPIINHGFLQEPQKPLTFDVSVTLDPPIPFPQDIQDIKISGESPELTTHCKIWLMTKRQFSRTKSRNIMAMAPNSAGRGTLLCRYIREQKPPDIVREPEEALRFVSLIPFAEDIHQFEERVDVWTNSQKFLDEGGDYEEHAILLCNFLLYLKKDAYVVIGNAFPEGKTNYVLLFDGERENKIELWDPSNGIIYAVNDPLCPLFSVGCVFNRENIWANIQTEEIPRNMSFDLSSRFNWDKLFHSNKKRMNLYNMEISIQRQNLIYREPIPSEVQRFTRKLKDLLRRTHFELRTSINKTREEFDGVLEPTLVELLKYFEETRHKNLSLRNLNFENDKKMILDKLGDRFQEMFGYPLNFKKQTKTEIVQQVLTNTKFYALQEKEEVQFCYAVYVKAYTHKVYSIWVYSACSFVIEDMYV